MSVWKVYIVIMEDVYKSKGLRLYDCKSPSTPKMAYNT